MNDNGNWVTVNLRPETHKKLKEMKIHPNQSFDEVIRNLMENKD